MKKILYLGIMIAGIYIIRTFIVEGIYIASASMEPALKTGNFYFVNKLAYRFAEPRRSDFVVIAPPVSDDKEFVKRIIGLPGEKLEIRDKAVYINEKKLQEPYAVFSRKDELLVGDNLGPLDIPLNSYFLMGDNRDESRDSRDFKDGAGNPLYFIKKEEIRGRLVIVF